MKGEIIHEHNKDMEAATERCAGSGSAPERGSYWPVPGRGAPCCDHFEDDSLFPAQMAVDGCPCLILGQLKQSIERFLARHGHDAC